MAIDVSSCPLIEKTFSILINAESAPPLLVLSATRDATASLYTAEEKITATMEGTMMQRIVLPKIFGVIIKAALPLNQ